MALTGKLVADFADFYNAVQKAEVELRGLETGAGKVETSLNRMVDSFSGRKIVQDANIMAEAVTRIGGASKLTEAEQAKVNRTVTEALAKYRALGQEAPASLRKLAADTRGVSDATDKASSSAFNWQSTLKGAAGALGIAFSVGAIKNWVSSVLDAAGRVDDLSKKLGVSATFVQQWEQVLSKSGGSIDTVDRAISFMNRTLSEGDKSTVKILRDVGLSFDAIRVMSPQDAFNTITSAISKIEDPMLKAEAATKLFSRTGQDLLPALTADIDEVRKNTKVMSDETIARLDAAGDAWTEFGNRAKIVSGEMISVGLRMTESWESFFVEVSAAFNPAMTAQQLRHLRGMDEATQKLASTQKAAAESARLNAIEVGKAADAAQAKADKAAKATEDAAKKAAAEAEARAKALLALQDQLFGRDLIAKAEQYARALGSVDNVAKLTAAAQAEMNKVMGAAYEVLVRAGQGASEAVQQYRMLRDMTVDWVKVNAQINAMPDPFLARNQKRTQAMIDTGTAILKQNQELDLNVAAWMGAEAAADRAMSETVAAVAEVPPAAAAASTSITNNFLQAFQSVSAGARRMTGDVTAQLRQLDDAYRRAGLFVDDTRSGIINFWRTANPSSPGSMPSFASGGPVTKDGPIFAHKGEFVVPKGGGLGNVTINVYGGGDARAQGRQIFEALAAEAKRKGVKLGTS